MALAVCRGTWSGDSESVLQPGLLTAAWLMPMQSRAFPRLWRLLLLRIMSCFTLTSLRAALPPLAAKRPAQQQRLALPAFSGLRASSGLPQQLAGARRGPMRGGRVASTCCCRGPLACRLRPPTNTRPCHPSRSRDQQQQQPRGAAERRPRVCDAARQQDGPPGPPRRPAQGAHPRPGHRGAAPRKDQDHQGARAGHAQGCGGAAGRARRAAQRRAAARPAAVSALHSRAQVGADGSNRSCGCGAAAGRHAARHGALLPPDSPPLAPTPHHSIAPPSPPLPRRPRPRPSASMWTR